MRHKFRKYISKRGSALFMVLSVMTALIVTSMAMYFSVVSSKKTQYAIFNQQQSYQSALSLNESLLGGIIARTDDANKSGFTALSQAIDQMQVGQTITTSNNDFTSFAGDSRDDEDQVGAYIADITFLCDDAEGRLFDFAVTSMINGTESTVHQYVIIPKLAVQQPAGGGGVPDKLFTSSGFTPTNSSIGMGAMYCDVFYDTEYAFMMPYGDLAKGDQDNEAKLQYMGNVYAAGSMEMDYGVEKTYEKNEWAGVKPIQWVIRNNFKLSNEKHCTPFPGDDVLGGVTYEDKTNRVIVGGDFIVESDSLGMTNVDIYVLGNVIIKGNAASKFGTSVRLFVVGNVTDENGNPHSGFMHTYKGVSSWNTASSNPHKVIDTNECIRIIRETTTSITYYDWNTAYYTGENAIPGINTEIDINLVWDLPTVITWSPDNQGCTIRNITAGGSGWSSSDYDNGFKIIIDTGDDPDNLYTIKLTGYLDGGKTFSWFPRKEDETNVWVLLRGKGSVRFEVPNGVNYENWSGRTFVMHEDWLSYGFNSQNNRSDERALKQYIHWDCGDNCAVCKNEATLTTEECEICGLPKYKIECPTHHFSKVICRDCEGDYYKTIEENGKVYSIATCSNRVDYSATGGKNPTTNIYLTMCGANSSIKFTEPDKEAFSVFWGYIYAPYASIHFDGKQSSGKRINFLGGIACADFNLAGMHQYIGLYPDKLPGELMTDECRAHPLVGIDDKSWKKSFGEE